MKTICRWTGWRDHPSQREEILDRANPPFTPFAMKTLDLNEKYALINAQWTPHVVAELNGQQVKLAKIEGEFVWHAHEQTKCSTSCRGRWKWFSRFRAARRPGTNDRGPRRR